MPVRTLSHFYVPVSVRSSSFFHLDKLCKSESMLPLPCLIFWLWLLSAMTLCTLNHRVIQLIFSYWSSSRLKDLCTQTLQQIYDHRNNIVHSRRLLRLCNLSLTIKIFSCFTHKRLHFTASFLARTFFHLFHSHHTVSILGKNSDKRLDVTSQYRLNGYY